MRAVACGRMTIDDGTQRAVATTPGIAPPHMRQNAASSARDLERYAGLFAARTQVMKSSAMRDLMAITERAEVISLAGGLPDTSTFPPESLAALMARVAADSAPRALQYGPTEGIAAVKRRCIAEVMAAEGMDGRPRRHPRHDRRPAGHRPRLQDARSTRAT